MTTYTSTIPGDIPGVFGYDSASQTTSNGDIRWDVAIGGIPFLMQAAPNSPYFRQTAPIQKPQFDTSQEAGEQTLDLYWLRSQTSWHRGRGINYYEPGQTNVVRAFDPFLNFYSSYRFDESVGVDIWTRDQVTLLKKMSVLDSVTSGQIAYVSGGKKTDGTNVIWTNDNGTVKRWVEAGTSTTITAAATTPATRVAVCGGVIAVGHSTGVDLCSVDGSAFATQWTQAAGSVVTPYYAKGRIVASIDNKLYTLPLTGASAAITTAGTLIHTHDDSNFRWTSVTDGPTAIYAAGNGGGSGTIYKFALADAGSGTLPKLGQAYEVAQMPTGETIYCIKSYLGGYLGIGTSKGLRVAVIDSNGNLTYGPLIIETSYPVRDLVGSESFIYATVEKAIDGYSGAVRINLGTPLPQEDLRFACAWDAQTHTTGVPSSIAFFGDGTRVCLGVTGEGTYAQSATLYEDSGYIQSGRIRYDTTEQKLFRLAVIRALTNGGQLTLSKIDEASTETSLYSISDSAGSGEDITISPNGSKHEFLAFKVTLKSDTSTHTKTPTLQSLLIKALPAPKRQRLVQFPLMCFDYERDSTGTPYGYPGFAYYRISQLEANETDLVEMNVQDFTTGEAFSGVVEGVEFQRTAPRSTDGQGNFGGLLKVTMRILS